MYYPPQPYYYNEKPTYNEPDYHRYPTPSPWQSNPQEYERSRFDRGVYMDDVGPYEYEYDTQPPSKFYVPEPDWNSP